MISTRRIQQGSATGCALKLRIQREHRAHRECTRTDKVFSARWARPLRRCLSWAWRQQPHQHQPGQAGHITMSTTTPVKSFPGAAEAGDLLEYLCHEASCSAGWWTDLRTGEPIITRPHVVGEKLMLIVSEISEAMEGHRKGLQDDKLPHRPMIEVELADAVIRIADLAGALGLDLGGAIAEKLAYNAVRPDHKCEARLAEGGKAY